jgi:hypothetical protein
MSLSSWLHSRNAALTRTSPRRRRACPHLEWLETRCVPTSLVPGGVTSSASYAYSVTDGVNVYADSQSSPKKR